MKKVIILSVVTLSFVAFQSCKKSYSCECIGQTTELNYGKLKKDEVNSLKTECESDTTAVCVFTQK